jgi:hypothetical protein
MWPSLEAATFVSDVANFALLASLVVGVIATALIVWMANVKEAHWDHDRQASRERVAGLESSVADADARAADANRIAEGERLARIKIEAGLASRRLTPDQSAKLTAALRGMAAQVPVINVTRLGDKEAFDFGTDLIQAIRAAGVQVNLSQIGMVTPPPYGLNVADNPAGALREALEAASISPVTYAVNTSAIPSILIGLKPPPF